MRRRSGLTPGAWCPTPLPPSGRGGSPPGQGMAYAMGLRKRCCPAGGARWWWGRASCSWRPSACGLQAPVWCSPCLVPWIPTCKGVWPRRPSRRKGSVWFNPGSGGESSASSHFFQDRQHFRRRSIPAEVARPIGSGLAQSSGQIPLQVELVHGRSDLGWPVGIHQQGCVPHDLG